jgi:outer membrane protein assembly factor BamB
MLTRLLIFCIFLPSLAQAADVPDLRTRKTGDDWPQFLGPTGDSKSRETGILTKWPVEGPRVVWQRKLAEGYAMPSISLGRLFMFDRVGDHNRLTCMKSETGEELWKFEYPTDFEDLLGYSGGPRCCPVIDGERVYIIGGEGVLHCLHVVDGKVLWKRDTSKEFGVVKNFFGVGATPVVEGGLLIMQVGGSPPGQPADLYKAGGKVTPNGSGIVAFDKLTGKVVYQITDELASYASPALATIGDRRWCFVFARGGLVGFEPHSGKVDFHFPWRAESLESVNASNPVVVGDHVFISETYQLGAALLKVKPPAPGAPAAAGAAEVVWSDKDKRTREKSMMTHWNTPIHLDGYIYGCSGRHDGNAELRCVELKTGKVMWSVNRVHFAPLNADLRLTRSSLLYVDGHFICLTEHGVVVLLKVNPQRFEPVAVTVLAPVKDGDVEPALRNPAWAAPILSHGLLYLRGRDLLLCMELMPK